MKGCELCSGTARMYCESDQASLCFDCDAKVHGANFLVARHSRVLLCRSCQSLTPWKASGPRLGPTVSVCDRCVGRSTDNSDGDDYQEDVAESGEGNHAEEEEEADDDMEEDDDEEEEEEEEEGEGEEQVVPWTMEEMAPPPMASSSSSEEESATTKTWSTICNNGSLKRMRQNADLLLSCSSQDNMPCSSSRPSYILAQPTMSIPAGTTSADDEASSESFRPLKDRKKNNFIRPNSHQLAMDFMSSSSARLPI